MSVERKYHCNFCQGLITQDQPGVGLEWDGKALEIVALPTAEEHLCNECLVAIHAVASALFRSRHEDGWE